MRDGTGRVPVDLAAAIALGGEMGRRFAAYDWAAHPLGPLDGWPPEYRAVAAVALTSRFPTVLWLDPEELYLVYNDGYVPMLGEKHPAALGAPGKEVWWDIWDSIGPMLGGVIATGEATWSDDLFLPITEGGRPGSGTSPSATAPSSPRPGGSAASPARSTRPPRASSARGGSTSSPPPRAS
ncbi:hypothetical protein ACFQV2_25950 [Actinokineospora soli]|uniref:Uncharacterized protein n=1 Tax=Actinokineospora soli TaxID=1048753 RepID=A0ABW2TRH1_9PSEU